MQVSEPLRPQPLTEAWLPRPRNRFAYPRRSGRFWSDRFDRFDTAYRFPPSRTWSQVAWLEHSEFAGCRERATCSALLRERRRVSAVAPGADGYTLSASSTAFASLRSGVSKPSVNQP